MAYSYRELEHQLAFTAGIARTLSLGKPEHMIEELPILLQELSVCLYTISGKWSDMEESLNHHTYNSGYEAGQEDTQEENEQLKTETEDEIKSLARLLGIEKNMSYTSIPSALRLIQTRIANSLRVPIFEERL